MISTTTKTLLVAQASLALAKKEGSLSRDQIIHVDVAMRNIITVLKMQEELTAR